jgi:hypothetical protein
MGGYINIHYGWLYKYSGWLYKYSSGEGALLSPSFYFLLLAGSIICCAAFGMSFRFVSRGIAGFISGTIFSYLGLIGVVLASAGLSGSLAETLMWLAIMVLFGVPVMAPLIALSAFSARQLINQQTPNKPEIASPRKPSDQF